MQTARRAAPSVAYRREYGIGSADRREHFRGHWAGCIGFAHAQKLPHAVILAEYFGKKVKQPLGAELETNNLTLLQVDHCVLLHFNGHGDGERLLAVPGWNDDAEAARGATGGDNQKVIRRS